MDFRIRVRRSSLILAVVVAALAFPLGALAVHQFSDVPTGASYHDDVEALVDAGITSGCGDGKYCPSDPVTRAQMAQFLNRLGSLDGVYAPSVDADKVDGLDASDLAARWAHVAADGTITDQSGGISVTSSFDGGVYLNFGSSALDHAIVATVQYRNNAPANLDGTVIASPCAAVGTTCIPSGTNNTNHVFVLTRDGTGDQTSLPFYIALLP